MKKIMFNDRYGLTRAVLEGKKTMTRRTAFYGGMKAQYKIAWPEGYMVLRDGNTIIAKSAYKVGEEIAIAQKYRDCYEGSFGTFKNVSCGYLMESAGWNNKMFVKADWMPHRIRITNIKVKRLQDISEEDAMREGVFKYDKPPLHHEADMFAPWAPYVRPYKWDRDNLVYRCTARYAFAYLIDKISGGGTWNRNPWVFVYTFELIQ